MPHAASVFSPALCAHGLTGALVDILFHLFETSPHWGFQRVAKSESLVSTVSSRDVGLAERVPLPLRARRLGLDFPNEKRHRCAARCQLMGIYCTSINLSLCISMSRKTCTDADLRIILSRV